MKRVRVSAMALMIPFVIVSPSPASVDLFDKLKQKAEESVGDLTGENITGAVGLEPDEAEESTATTPTSSSSAKSAESSEAATGSLPTSPLKIAEGKLAVSPELFSGRPQPLLDERKLKDFVLVFYLQDRKDLQNRLKWRKHRASYEKKMLTESENAPATFPVAAPTDLSEGADVG